MNGQISPAIRRAPNSPFSAVKMGGPFSLRCLSPPSPPRSAPGIRKPCGLGCFGVAGPIQQGYKPTGFQSHAGRWHEPRGPPPSGGLYQPTGRKLHQTGEPWHLPCHGGNTAANLLSLEQPRAQRARSGVQGYYPCLRGRRKKAAARRIKRGRATRRATPMV